MLGITLGLDVGPNSIGWALIDETNRKIVDLGVRIFPEGVDNFDTKKERSRSEDRRIARGMRRQVARRTQRRRKLREALVDAGLFPSDPEAQSALYVTDPYGLRAKALREKLTPHEIGRVLLHLNQRRGFLSNRKKDRGDAEVRGMLEEINELAAAMKADGADTLGEYLHSKREAFSHTERAPDDRARHRHTHRNMLEAEFAAIWDTQAAHHPDLLTERLRYGALGAGVYPSKPRMRPDGMSELEAFGLHGLMYFQRKMYWPRSVVGLCELEPKRKRCPRADRAAQRFRMLQEVNNLRFVDPGSHEERALDEGQRAIVLGYLATREKATFDDLRKKLGFIESIHFNLERGKRASIKGMATDSMMAKAAGKTWHDRPAEQKDAIVRMLLNNERDDDAIAHRLVSEFGFTADDADRALGIDFPAGYVHLSQVAIEKLLPHLERGLVYQSESDPERSALHAAGYLRRDELRRRLFDKLPDPSRTRDCPIGDIPNPVVKRALVELRKVVNAIVREYGKPDAVHLEMARSVRMGPQARSEYNTRIREIEARRDGAADKLRATQIKVSREGILRLLLWEDQSHECIYCGQAISQRQLFGGEVDVDHILPYSRCLDDSQANKVVCHRRCNHDKGQWTPHEWLADSDPERYERICQVAESLMRKEMIAYGKYRKFLQKELKLDEFIARQLTDTGYIARATGEYLRCLFEDNHAVLGLKGQHTATLRRQWGLNTVLRQDGEDLKNREDHRHHAVDAAIVALTNRSRLQELSQIRSMGGFDRTTGEVYELADPWDGFRDDVETAINRVNISHRVARRVSGALHEDTLYGPTDDPGVFVVRKPVDALSANEVPLIRDPAIRGIVERRLAEYGVDVGRGKQANPKVMKQALCDVNRPLTMPSGVPIRRVRVLRKEKTIQPIRSGDHTAYVKPGNTHHLCIFEWEHRGKPKRDAVFVTMLDAIGRVNRKEAIIQRTPSVDHPTIPRDAKFVMSLSRGEMMVATLRDGSEALLTFRTAASTQGQLYFARHTDARKSGEQEKIVFKANTLNARKVTVDPLGRIRWAND